MPAGTIVGEYKIESRLGQGGMGAVYAARHPIIGKRVAIKVLSFFYSRDADLVRRFTDEARAVNKIGHPNIIDVFAFGQLADGRHYFIMEYLEGETMAAWLDRGWPPADEARRFLLQTCEALEAAHRENIVHRDLKPENIWIARPKHGEPYVKVLDFGLAKLMATDETKSATKTGMVMGTPQFMSPEQCVGRGVDQRTDIYAMGAIVFRVYCGRLAFDGSSSAEVIAAQLYQPPPKPSSLASMPAALEQLMLDCLDKDPNRRPSSAAELSMRFRQATEAVGGVTALLGPIASPEPPKAETRKGFATAQSEATCKPPFMRKHRRPVIALLALLMAGAVLFTILHRAPRPSSVPSTGTQPFTPPVPAAPAVPPSAPSPAPPATEEAPTVPIPPAAAPAEPVQAKPGTRIPKTAPSPTRSKPSRATRQGLIQENPFQ